jgi:NTE family protein
MNENPANDDAPGGQARARTAFVLGGGGHRGAHEVGMLRALLEAGVEPDVISARRWVRSTAVLAADPTLDAVARLEHGWSGLGEAGVFEESLSARLGTVLRSRTHLYTNAALHRMLDADLPARLIEDLAVPFQCVANSIERAAEHWFSSGPIADAVLASCAIPGLLPPVQVGGEHFLDGGIVNSVPVGRAVALGARTVYVLQVGHLERPLAAPSRPWEVAAVAFEVARRHRFAQDTVELPADVTVHIPPTGSAPSDSAGWSEYIRYRDFTRTQIRIEQSYRASADCIRPEASSTAFG